MAASTGRSVMTAQRSPYAFRREPPSAAVAFGRGATAKNIRLRNATRKTAMRALHSAVTGGDRRKPISKPSATAALIQMTLVRYTQSLLFDMMSICHNTPLAQQSVGRRPVRSHLTSCKVAFWATLISASRWLPGFGRNGGGITVQCLVASGGKTLQQVAAQQFSQPLPLERATKIRNLLRSRY